jgi:hypothetical protein
MTVKKDSVTLNFSHSVAAIMAEVRRLGPNGPVRPMTPEERLEFDMRREAEMAACPYVACECRWHEDDW